MSKREEMTQGFIESVEYRPVLMKNNTNVTQCYYDALGEMIEIKPGQKKKVMKSVVVTHPLSAEEVEAIREAERAEAEEPIIEELIDPTKPEIGDFKPALPVPAPVKEIRKRGRPRKSIGPDKN